jgi:hypothetical protein
LHKIRDKSNIAGAIASRYAALASGADSAIAFAPLHEADFSRR